MTVAVKDENSFHQLFQSLPQDEKLIEEYSCSYTEGGSVSIGRLYISQHHVSYAPKIGSTQIIIPIKDIINISKKYSVYLFPNAIEIITSKDQKYFFSAFLSRDLAYATLQTIVQAGGGTRTKIFEDAMNGTIEEKNVIKSSSDEIEMEEPFQDAPTYSTFQPSSTLSSSTSQLSEPSNNGQQQETTSSSSSSGSNTPPSSQSPSSSMLNSAEKDDSTTTTNSQNTNGQTSNSNELDENLVVGSQPNEEQQQQQTTSNANLTSSTTSGSTPPNSLPPTPKKTDSQLNLNDLTATPNKQSTAQPQASTSKPSPVLKRKNTVDVLPSQQNQQQTAASPMRHTISTSTLNTSTTNTAATSSTNLTASAAPISNSSNNIQTSSPSPASVAVSNTLQYKSIPVKDKCEHIVASEFEEAPWGTEKFPITVEEFYNVIIRTDFWALVNTTHGYTEQVVNEWKNGTCCASRAMEFRAAINFKIGPKSTRVYQTQRCRLKNKDELMMECSSVSKDVPYGDSFSVENLLSVASDDGGNGCIVKLSSKIKFTKTLWGIASMIQKSAYQGNKDYFVLWFSMVRNQIEAYSFNKLKQAKSQIPDPLNANQQQQPAQPAQQPQKEVVQPQNAQPTSQQQPNTDQTTVNNQKQVSASDQDGSAASTTVVASNLSLTTLWKNLSASEKQIFMIVIGIISILFIGLIVNVYSTSRTNQWLNQELYKFSDSIVLLDGKLNSLIQGSNPAEDTIVVGNIGNIGNDRLQYLQKQLDTASALMQRTQSLISSLQGELSIEALKLKKIEEMSGSSWSPYIITIILVAGSAALHFTGLLEPLRSLLPF